MLAIGLFHIHFFPRTSWTWDEFTHASPLCSIALDGMVRGGPRFDPVSRRINFDHHDGVVREATMSTAKQVFFAIKGGLIKIFHGTTVHIFVNDTDQDTSLATWLLLNHALFEQTKSIPSISRLLELTDRLDVTGGAFPMELDDQLLRRHAWVFEPYTSLRKSGELARADAGILQDNLEAIIHRLDRFMMGESGETELDTRHVILYDDPRFRIVDEIGGNDARYALFAQGMDAFISIVARRSDGRIVYTIGRRSRYIDFPIPQCYAALNEAEKFSSEKGWNGSDIIGGSPRDLGSGLPWEQVRDIILTRVLDGQ